MYHYVRDLKNSKFPNIKGLDIKEFVQQINYLKKRFNIISIEDFYLRNYNINSNNCILTFDDGYIDHYEYVFDILLKNNIKGAFYAPVNVIENNLVLDVNKIHTILACADENKILTRLKFHYNKLFLEEKIDSKISSINTTSSYDSNKTVIIKKLLQSVLDYKTRQIICNALLEDFVQISESELFKSLYMTKNHIVEMIDNGMHFGSHGKEHFRFTSLNYEQQEVEIKASINFLKSVYKNDFLLTMCYPYGDYNNNTLDLVKKYNFKLGLTTIQKKYELSDDILQIPRYDTNFYYPKK